MQINSNYTHLIPSRGIRIHITQHFRLRGGEKKADARGLKLGTARDERNCFWAGPRRATRDDGSRLRSGERLHQQELATYPSYPYAREVVSVLEPLFS